MMKLQKPEEDVRSVFIECISNIRDLEFKKRLEQCESEIVETTLEFEEKIVKNTTYTIVSKSKVSGIVTTEEMCKKVYTCKMAHKKAPGRKYYDKYMSVPKHGICPLCGHRTVSTLDHYLPKAKYPALAVSPSNLIPSCKDCNIDKGTKEFISSNNETIHPYFDNIENESWLYAKVSEKVGVTVTFYVKKPESWNNLLYERVKNHFVLFKLNQLYSSNAAVEIAEIQFQYKNLFDKTGTDGVKDQLKEVFESRRKVSLNSWRTAMYRALYESHWFCTEWFKNK